MIDNRSKLKLGKYLVFGAFVNSIIIVAVLTKIFSNTEHLEMVLLVPSHEWLLIIPVQATGVTALTFYVLSGRIFHPGRDFTKSTVLWFCVLVAVIAFLISTLLYTATGLIFLDIGQLATLSSFMVVWLSIAFFGTVLFGWLIVIVSLIVGIIFWKVTNKIPSE